MRARARDDPRPVAKVIGFGIAKANGHRLTESTLVTGIGRTLRTPAYMSPEQCNADFPDIDTRADICSMGAMLYDMLVGRLPYDKHLLMRAGAAAPMLLRELGLDIERRMRHEPVLARPRSARDRAGATGQAPKRARRAH